MSSEKINPNIPGMDLDKKYTANPVMPENSAKVQKEMEKTKKELEKIKSFIVKKYSYVKSISLLPPQGIKVFIDEEEVPKETEKYLQLYVVVPEDKFKEIPKVKQEIVKQIDSLQKNLSQKVWLQIKTPVDIWKNCLDSKFELTSAVAMSFPLYDDGFLGALRVAEIHKSLVLQKFEKYVVSYVIGGGLVRGESIKESDVDVFVIINDTDVKRMPRLELKERLRGIIYQYVAEATALAGVKNRLEPQIYLLTDFWESVKDAHPVMFTFIRDGIPIYDRGTFMPWKALLKMGKLKPSPEAIDMFMSLGDNTKKRAKRALLDIFVHDIYWGVTTPSQALLMLNGSPPPSPKHLVADMKKVFVTKEKMLEMKYIKILEKVVKFYKDYEHEKVSEVKGAEVDTMLKEMESYLKRLKELREQIDKRAQEKTIEQIYTDLIELLKAIIGKKSQAVLISEFEKNFVKKGKFTFNHLKILKEVFSARADFKKGKLDAHKVDNARKKAVGLINDLIEFSQRCDLAAMDKCKMVLNYKENGSEKIAELVNADGKSFLFKDTIVKKLTEKIEDSDMKEVSKALEAQKAKQSVEINPKVFELLKKELGKFEIVF